MTLTRSDLVALLDNHVADVASAPSRDLTVEEVAHETRRAPSTVRGWLISGELRGYKINNRDWRVPRPALQEYLTGESAEPSAGEEEPMDDIGAWRRVRRA